MNYYLSMIQIEFNKKDFPWITDETDQENDCNNEIIKNKLIKYINIGKMVSDMVEISSNPHSEVFNSLFNKIDNVDKNINDQLKNKISEIDKINTSMCQKVDTIHNSILQERNEQNQNIKQFREDINKFTGTICTSSKKGKLGECIVENIINDFFKEDQLANTSKIAKAGDYHMHCKDGFSILLEIKTYQTVVDQKEIDKFKRDIQHNNMSGIFISTTSKIVKKKIMEIEELPTGEIMLFVSNTGIEGPLIIWSIILMKELINKKNKGTNNLHLLDTDKILENISQYEDIYNMISKLTNFIQNTKNDINNSLQNLYDESLKCETQCKYLTEKIINSISKEINSLDSTIQIIEQSKMNEFLNKILEENPKLHPIYSCLIKMLNEFNIFEILDENNESEKNESSIRIIEHGDKWKIINNKNENICEIKRFKNKLEAKIIHKRCIKMTIEINEDSIDLLKNEIKKVI